MDQKPPTPLKPKQYTDQEINELADWANDLTIDQIFFLKKSYQEFMQALLSSEGNGYLH